MKVYNLINNNGKPAPNQFVLVGENKEQFKSYDTLIAEIEGGRITLDTNALKHSKTTSKHLFIYLKKDRKQIEAEIEAGIILVKDLV